MQTIGERLEEARKRKGVSIREASEVTKIRGDYLQKFEGNHFDINLPEIYVRGFLRTYATYLKLPTEKIVTDFNSASLGNHSRVPRKETRESFGRVDLQEPSRLPDTPVEPPPAREPAAVVAPIEPPREAAPAREARHSSAAIPPAPGNRQLWIKIAAIGGSVVALLLIVVLVRSLLDDGPARTEERPTAVNTTPVPARVNTMRLIALGPVEVNVRHESDNRVLFNGRLLRDQSQSFTYEGRAVITVNEGRNLQFELNGERFGMGKPGANTTPPLPAD